MPLPSPISLLALAGVVLFWIVSLLRSPLWRVPGPFLSRFTSLILKWHELRANRTQYIHKLHLQYGPVVRLTPREVAFASATAVKEIYGSGGSGYDKTEFYDLFKIYGKRTMFTTLNKTDHAIRKRVLADRYANSNILRSELVGGIEERSQRFVQKCWDSVGGSLDLYINLHSYAFDCVTYHLFHPHGSDSLRNKKDEEVMREVTFDDSLQNRLIEYYSPTTHRLAGKVLSFVASPRETPLADEFVVKTCRKSDTRRFTLLSRLQEKSHGLEQIDIAAECLDHMAAGIDTTGDALCFLIWELSQSRSVQFQKRLQDQLRMHPGVNLDQLEFLDAVVLEGLRCFPAIPMSLPRYTPPGGRDIDGFYIPEKTIVSCQAYSVHRVNEEIFPQPDLFNPDRWLTAQHQAERKRLFFAFASGGRGCIGKHLAITEMKLLLRNIYSQFTTLPDQSMTEDMMEMSDQPISTRPKGQKCLIRFCPLD